MQNCGGEDPDYLRTNGRDSWYWEHAITKKYYKGAPLKSYDVTDLLVKLSSVSTKIPHTGDKASLDQCG